MGVGGQATMLSPGAGVSHDPSVDHWNSVLLLYTGVTEEVWACQVVQWVKNLPAMQEMKEMWVQSLSQGDPLEEVMATHSSIPAWRILPLDRGAWWATVHRVAKSWT